MKRVMVALIMMGALISFLAVTENASANNCGGCGVYAGDPSGPDPDMDAECISYGGTSVPYDDADGNFFGWACFGLPVDETCPDGTVLTEPSIPGPEWAVCSYPGYDEGLNDHGYDDGHQPWQDDSERDNPDPDNMADGDAQDGSSKALYPVIGVAYVANTNGDGVICRDSPAGNEVIILAEGVQVSELADGIQDGWQLIAYTTGQPACYVDADYLLDDAPEMVASDEQESDPGIVTSEESTVNDVSLIVTSLPSTGSGSSLHQPSMPAVEADTSITSDEKPLPLWGWVILGAFVAIMVPCALYPILFESKSK